jgi:SP family myo-inositol transporter-like MFS transporter 13
MVIDPRSNVVPRRIYGRFLLLIAGLGGLLYGIDIGIIGGALPYLEATSGLNAGQLSMIVAAVLLGSVFSTLFAGSLADLMGRRRLMIVSGMAFVLSIPIIALSHGYAPLFLGRLLQGISGGLVGIVVPLYLAECLPPSERGRGTGAFQWLLTLGIVAAALIGVYYSYRVAEVVRTATPAAIFAFKNQAWRRIFWLSLPPGVLFVAGSFFVAESPRWLFSRGRYDAARLALLQARTEEQAAAELEEMEASAAIHLLENGESKPVGSLLQRKYIVPFMLACAILFCNTATGINSIIGYNTGILLQSGLSDLQAHWGYALFTAVNFLVTMVGMSLVDRVGRRRLFLIGTAGIVASLVSVGVLFAQSEAGTVDRARAVQTLVSPDQALTVSFTPVVAQDLLDDGHFTHVDARRASLVVVYSCGGFTSATNPVRSDEDSNAATLSRQECLPQNRFEAFLRNPFANLDAARQAPLTIDRALISAVPDRQHGWLVALALYLFMAFFAVGPGVCVWLALTELMPARIRSNGMSIALVLNQMVSTTLAAIFLPFVGKHGYSTIFFVFAGFSLCYLLTIALFLPETKGKSLEQIEQFFDPAWNEVGISETSQAR